MWLMKMGYKALWNSEINYLKCLWSNFVRNLNKNAPFRMIHNPVANFAQQSLFKRPLVEKSGSGKIDASQLLDDRR